MNLSGISLDVVSKSAVQGIVRQADFTFSVHDQTV